MGRRITTVGDLREFLKDKPDEMEVVGNIGPDVNDVILDSCCNSLKDGSEDLYATLETRCDGIERIYITVDAEMEEED